MSVQPPALSLGERFRIGASLMAPLAILWLVSRRGWVPLNPWWCAAAIPAALLLGVLLPRQFAGWHRISSAIQAWIGRRLVAIVLGLVFGLAVVPLAVLLRLGGKSFLDGPPGESYWKPARPPGALRDQF